MSIGNGQWTAVVRDATSGAPTCEINATQIATTRALDTPASASVIAEACGCDCSDARPLYDELWVYRNGEPWVWGPIPPDGIARIGDNLIVTGFDRSWWSLNQRVTAADITGTPAERVAQLFAMNPMGNALGTAITLDDGEDGTTETTVGESTGAVIDELSRSTVDWTVIGDQVLIGAPEIDIGGQVLNLGNIDDAGLGWAGEGWTSASVLETEDGEAVETNHLTREMVPWTLHYSVRGSNTSDVDGIDATLANPQPLPALTLDGFGLSCTNPIEMDDLIPGRLTQFGTACFDEPQLHTLTGVATLWTVGELAAGTQRELVAISTAPTVRAL